MGAGVKRNGDAQLHMLGRKGSAQCTGLRRIEGMTTLWLHVSSELSVREHKGKTVHKILGEIRAGV